MQINLPPELQALVAKRCKRNGMTVDEFIESSIRKSEASRFTQQTPMDVMAIVSAKLPDLLDEFVNKQISRNPDFDDSRAAMYEDR